METPNESVNAPSNVKQDWIIQMRFLIPCLLLLVCALPTRSALSQTENRVASHCLEVVEPGGGQWFLGAIRNKCSYPVNFVYCFTKHNLVFSQQECRNGALEQQHSVGAFGTKDGDTRGEDVMGMACRAPWKPQRPQFEGSFIRATCATDEEWKSAGNTPGSSSPPIPPQNKPAPKPPSSTPRHDSTAVEEQAAIEARDAAAARREGLGPGWVVRRTREGCQYLVGKHSMVSDHFVTKEISWNGACTDGFTHGPGRFFYIRNADPALVALEGTMVRGVFHGAVMTYGTGNYGGEPRPNYSAYPLTPFTGQADMVNMGCPVGYAPCSPARSAR